MKKVLATMMVLIIGITILSPSTDICSSTGTYSSEDYPFDPSDPVIVDALDYLSDQQAPDGSIGGFSTSAWATMAIAAAGEDPHDWSNLVSYLESNVDLLDPDRATDWERHTLAIVACNENPGDFGGINFVAKIISFYDGSQIGDPTILYDDIFGILALISAGMDQGTTIIQQVKTHIKNEQETNGGWGDVDSTAAAVMALISSGENPGSEVIQDALDFMKTEQTGDGGFRSWGTTNSATTSWAVDAIVATGQDPTSSAWEKNGNNPIDYLLSLQQEDGSFNWSANQQLSPEWMTSYVIPALLGVPYPVKIYSPSDEWMGYIRIEGKIETVWKGDVTVGPSYITAKNTSSGQNETYYIPYPSVLGALDEASKSGGFSYGVEYWPDWDAFLVTRIGADSNWWHYWVDYDLPMVGCGKYELTEEDHMILWGYVEDWYPNLLKISVNKSQVNTSEAFTVTVLNRTNYPADDATVYIGSSEYVTNEQGKVTTHIDTPGTYEIYAEKQGHVRSEKVTINVKSKPIVTITKPEQRALYFMNIKLRIKLFRTIIIGPIDIEVQVNEDVENVEFFINNQLKFNDTEPPFTWKWDERAFFKKTIKVTAYADNENYYSDEREVIIFQL